MWRPNELNELARLSAVHGQLLRRVDPEVWRVLALCCPGARWRGAAAFGLGDGPAAARSSDEWEWWLAESFFPHILPAFRTALRHGAREEPREVRTADELLDEQFGPSAAGARSRAAGRRLLADYHPPMRSKALSTVREWAATGTTPGHFPIVFALRCAVFHIPVTLGVTCYLFQEWQAATGEEYGFPMCTEMLLDAAEEANMRSAEIGEEGGTGTLLT